MTAFTVLYAKGPLLIVTGPAVFTLLHIRHRGSIALFRLGIQAVTFLAFNAFIAYMNAMAENNLPRVFGPEGNIATLELGPGW